MIKKTKDKWLRHDPCANEANLVAENANDKAGVIGETKFTPAFKKTPASGQKKGTHGR